MLSEEQVKQIKEQLLKQLENWPEEQRGPAKEQIESMGNQELEEFIAKNKLAKTEENPQCIFCSIVKSKIPSHKIKEDENAIAILELNPISKGHTIIIPKQHASIQEPSKEISVFAKEISALLSEKLQPKRVDVFPSEMFGHTIINLLPVYNEENEKSPREKAEDSELQSLQEQLTQSTQLEKFPEEIQEEPEKPKEIFKFPRRIP